MGEESTVTTGNGEIIFMNYIQHLLSIFYETFLSVDLECCTCINFDKMSKKYG